jgi:hypothetical protein
MLFLLQCMSPLLALSVTFPPRLSMSAFGGKADIAQRERGVCF